MAGLRRRSGGLGGAAHAGRRGPRRHLDRAARSLPGGAGGGGGPLLRAGRPLAAGDAGDVAPARRLRHRDPAARSVRGPGAVGSRRPDRGRAEDAERRRGLSGSAPGSDRPDHPGPPGRAAPPVVLPAAPVVHRPARTRQPALQHAGGARRFGAARSPRAGSLPGGDPAPPRVVADGLLGVRGGSGRRAGAGHHAGGPLRPSRGGPVGPGGEPARGARSASGRRGGRTAVRSRAGAAAARCAVAAGRFPGTG